MIVVVQRVKSAYVNVEGTEVSRISRGLLLLAAVELDDTEEEIGWCAGKTADLRIFPDDQDKMNKSVKDIGGEILAVSQFTLAGDLKKGTRPSFSGAAPAEKAKDLFELFISKVKESGLKVQTGVFQAMMDVGLVNDGPVTIILKKSRKEKINEQ